MRTSADSNPPCPWVAPNLGDISNLVTRDNSHLGSRYVWGDLSLAQDSPALCPTLCHQTACDYYFIVPSSLARAWY